MQPRTDDYLGRLAFREGEYEHLQQDFDQQVDSLANFLEPGIKARLAVQLRHEFASTWATSIDQVARGLLEVPLPAGFEGKDEFRVDIERALREGHWLDEKALERESRACSSEVSQLVLARWFEILRTALGPSQQQPLTLNVLPEGMTLQEALEEVDLEAHGADHLTLATGWRSYWDQRRRLFYTDWVPVRVGALVLVPERADLNDGYMLYAEPTQAWLHAARQRDAAEAEEKSRSQDQAERARRLQNKLSTAVAAVASRFRTSVSAHVGIAETSRSRCLAMEHVWTQAFDVAELKVPEPGMRVVLETHVRSVAREILNADLAAPERRFAEAVGQGVDTMFACSHGPGALSTDDLERQLKTNWQQLHQVLVMYAGSRSMPVSDAADLYTASVVGTWAQNVEYDSIGKACVFDPGVFLHEPNAVGQVRTLATTADVEAAATTYLWTNGFDEIFHRTSEADIERSDSSWGDLHEHG